MQWRWLTPCCPAGLSYYSICCHFSCCLSFSVCLLFLFSVCFRVCIFHVVKFSEYLFLLYFYSSVGVSDIKPLLHLSTQRKLQVTLFSHIRTSKFKLIHMDVILLFAWWELSQCHPLIFISFTFIMLLFCCMVLSLLVFRSCYCFFFHWNEASVW